MRLGKRNHTINMKTIKIIVLTIGILFIAIQLIQPVHNKRGQVLSTDFYMVYTVPDSVQLLLQNACYDCHSNNTAYPWYNNVQPLAWFLADHVKEGKKELNFNEFASYKIGRQYRKLEEIIKETEEGEMPLESYTIIHGDAKLTATQKTSIANWATALRDTIKTNYPEDSLSRPKKPQAIQAK